MKAKILKVFMIAIILYTFAMVTYVHAEENNGVWENPTGGAGYVSDACAFSAIPNKTNVKPGEDITFELKVTNITASNGIKMVEFYVGNFDSNIFECKVRNYDEDKWSIINRENYITITSNNAEAWKTDETLAKVIYTPKSGVENKTYTVNINNVRITTGDDMIFLREDLNKTLSIRVGDSYSCTVSFTPDKTSVKPGEDITYDLKVSNINAGDGLKMVEFYIGNYDSSKFDCKIRNYNEAKWSLVNKEGYITISSNNSEAWKTDEILAKIIYTPKTGLTDNTYQTKINNIKATTADNNIITLTDATLNIKVASSQSTGGGTSETGTSGGSTSETGTSGGSTSGTGTSGTGTTGEDTSKIGSSGTGTENKDESEVSATEQATKESKTSSEEKSSQTKATTKKSNSSKSLPYSGDTETILIISGIIILISLSVWFFVRYKKINI